MTRRLTAPVVLMMLLLGLMIAAPVAAEQDYTCPDKSCAFTVPDSYSVVSNDAMQVIFSDSVSGGVFSVFAQDATGLTSLDDVVSPIVADAQTHGGYQAGPSDGTNTVLAGNPATLIEYVANNSKGTQVETAIFVTLYQGKAYQLIFSTIPANEDAFLASAKDIFDSYQFT